MKSISLLALSAASLCAAPATLPYALVDAGQDRCYNNSGEMRPPSKGTAFFGQDANYQGRAASYTISTDGLTAYDNNTGLTWQRTPETNNDGKLTHGDKLDWDQLLAQPAKLNAAKFGGFSDWRVPTIKEIYSLFDARGTDPSGYNGTDTSGLRPFLDSKTFPFVYGDVANGARIIDSQYASCTKFVGQSARGGSKVFGVNFADGRIKGYDQAMPGGDRKFRFFLLCVRGNPSYGKNDFQDNRDGTITDKATGLMWSKDDSRKGMNWEQALDWVQQMNAAKHLGHSDWRLPDIKELQSIVDYSKSPDTSNSPAIQAVFQCTQITNEAGKPDYPSYWSGTTHIGQRGGAAAMYVSFGRAGGFLPERMLSGGAPRRDREGPPAGDLNSTHTDKVKFVDVHGAGAQRSDPKTGDPKNFPRGRGPQGDVIRIYNHVRLVRGGGVVAQTPSQPVTTTSKPIPTAEPMETPAATEPKHPFPASPVISALDTNQNGSIDESEISKAANSLKTLDLNKDGKLTENEFRPKFQGGRGGDRGGRPPGGPSGEP